MDAVHIAGIEKQASDALLQLKTGGTDRMDITDLKDDLPEMILSLIERGRKINDYYDGNYGMLFIGQQCDDTVKSLSSILLEGAQIT